MTDEVNSMTAVMASPRPASIVSSMSCSVE